MDMIRHRIGWAAVVATAALGTLLAGSGVVAGPLAGQVTGSGPGGCYDPADFGAIPDDGQDDRDPIQRAMNAATGAGGGTVCLSDGHWTVTRAPAGSYNSKAALSTHAAHLSITGTGPGTVIELVGDQGNAATFVISLDPGASDIVIERLTIDTSAASNTEEQTHALLIGSGICAVSNGTCSMPISDVTVRDVRFVHPPLAGHRKGDCVGLLGNLETTPVKRVTIVGSSFINCARSGIAVQRNVFSLAVLGNHFSEQIGDTPFDGEASGGGWDEDLRLIGNSFAGSTVTYSAALTSYRRATITGNTFSGRGLFLYRTHDVIVADNTFDVTAISEEGVIGTGNVADGVKIDNNLIRRHGVPGPAIRVMPHSGGLPSKVSITNNTIVADGDSSGIYLESGRDIGIRDNDITLVDPAPNGQGISLRAGEPMDRITITGNTVTGPLSATGGNTYFAAVRLAASPSTIGRVTVALNTSIGAIRSLHCEQSVPGNGNYLAPVISLGNRWNVPPVCVATIQSGQ
ncbi:MAG TPA: right-handed parallel beta-helix repeat-containing protein [Candidatus Limnocylindrales bacterium]